MLEDVDKRSYTRRNKSNIKADRLNILILIVLYLLQGIVNGLFMVLPIILQNRKVSYANQAQFSIAEYPFCFKLLWAPLVDCVYFKKVGRRKTWLVPIQFTIGILLCFLSSNADDWLGSEDGSRKPKIGLLVAVFFVLLFLTSVQDVALDGWSLTMLHKQNIGYAGACQQIGRTTGEFMSYVLLIILNSKDFCNKFRTVPQNHGFVSLTNFIFFWSVAIIMTTTFILVFKKDSGPEIERGVDSEGELGFRESYEKLWAILQIRPLITLSLMMLTYRIPFGPLTGVAPLKMLDAGITQENYVLLTIPAFPIQMILSIVLRSSITGSRVLSFFIFIYVLKLTAGILLAVVLFFSPYARGSSKILPLWYYWVLLFAFNIRNVIKYLMLISLGAFFGRISDARYGGIYLTLLATVSNLGINWPVTLSLWCVDWLTVKSCVADKAQATEICYTKLDGFYVETILVTAIGATWLWCSRGRIHQLENLKESAWHVRKENETSASNEVSTALVDE